MSKKKSYKVFIAPSSDNERVYEGIGDLDKCLNHAIKHTDNDEATGTGIFIFKTKEERDAFVKGYESAIGYLGNGFYATKDETL